MRHIALILLAIAALATPALAQPAEIATKLVGSELDSPLFVSAPSGDQRLFVVEQTGRIRILDGGRFLDTPFLDVSDSISAGGERGLLGLAFHPGYAENGRFFVNYTDPEGDTQVVAYTVSSDPNIADAATAMPIISIEQPYSNHNGGWIGFGPDGFLYIGMGDGGAGGDPEQRGQNPDELLGKILRLDVDSATPYAIPPSNPFANGGGRPEIFALGTRNPWRMAFDGDNLYIGDVGQSAIEEIDVITTSDAGANLGWSTMEGDRCFRDNSCKSEGLVLPIHQYTHDEGGCSITGGYVYRGKALPALDGHYFFADLCDGKLRSLRYDDGAVSDVTDWSSTIEPLGMITSFGLDSAGELYITTVEGNLFQLVPAGNG